MARPRLPRAGSLTRTPTLAPAASPRNCWLPPRRARVVRAVRAGAASAPSRRSPRSGLLTSGAPMPRTTFHYRDPLAPRPTSQTIGVTALIEHDGKLLLERRCDTG